MLELDAAIAARVEENGIGGGHIDGAGARDLHYHPVPVYLAGVGEPSPNDLHAIAEAEQEGVNRLDFPNVTADDYKLRSGLQGAQLLVEQLEFLLTDRMVCVPRHVFDYGLLALLDSDLFVDGLPEESPCNLLQLRAGGENVLELDSSLVDSNDHIVVSGLVHSGSIAG